MYHWLQRSWSVRSAVTAALRVGIAKAEPGAFLFDKSLQLRGALRQILSGHA
jgi:hypothetical protein